MIKVDYFPREEKSHKTEWQVESSQWIPVIYFHNYSSQLLLIKLPVIHGLIIQG